MGTVKDEGGEEGVGRRASGVKSREPAGPAEAGGEGGESRAGSQSTTGVPGEASAR